MLTLKHKKKKNRVQLKLLEARKWLRIYEAFWSKKIYLTAVNKLQ